MTRSLVIELVPPAAISGTIVDEEGDPVPGCMPLLVPLQRKAGSPGGTVVQSGPGGDGTYRLEGIRPGRFLLALRCQAQPFEPRPLLPNDARPPSLAYPRLFYPAASDGSSAQVIDLAPGAERSGLDFQLKPVGVYQVEGTIDPATIPAEAGRLIVVLMSLDPLLHRAFGEIMGKVDRRSGSFSIPGVPPGSYRLMARLSGSRGVLAGAVERVDVVDRPVRSNLALRPAFAVTGTVEWGRESTAGGIMGSIYLAPVEFPSVGGAIRTMADADGHFRLEIVAPGFWWVHAEASKGFVQSVQAADREVTDGILDLTAGPPGPLKLIMSSHVATVLVTAASGSLVLVTSRDEQRSFATRTYPVDEQGSVAVRMLPPGTYRFYLDDPLLDEGRE
ncbi:MAG: hypothetical protein NTY38_14670, partial [Acidobacteria bacterium]|nr:hypothetical protein [Acidobacteriota bacterium]